MKKISLITVVLLLSAAWVVAQTSPSSSSSSQSPSSTSQQPSTTSPSSTQQPDTSASNTGEKGGNAIEGCLGGSAGSYTLTDASGTTYQLSGDTTKLSEHVGHEIKVWGDTGAGSSASASGASTSASSTQTLNVKRVKMVSSSCPTK